MFTMKSLEDKAYIMLSVYYINKREHDNTLLGYVIQRFRDIIRKD